MLLWLADFLSQYYEGFIVLRYLHLRAILVLLTAFVILFCLGPHIIRCFSYHQIGQSIRNDGPKSHFNKAGTPTMGGTVILFTILVSTLLWANLSNSYIWVLLLITVFFGIIGCVDDYKKVVLKNSRGLPICWKLIWQSIGGLGAAIFLYTTASLSIETSLVMPFFKKGRIDLGPFFIVLSYLTIIGTSNAVNLTDGLDGLAIMPIILITAALAVFAYISGHRYFAQYLSIPFIPGASELVVFCAAISGAGLAFLWFNTYPAQVFMGDVGALALGAALGVLAVIVRQEILLIIMGGIFVIETISVILQVTCFKLTGRKIFRMAPLHHHFELKGWPEPRVIIRFWIITLILVFIGLTSLKIC